MKCPNCKEKEGLSVDQGAGFTGEPLKECSRCGTVWAIKIVEGESIVDIIKQGLTLPATAAA